jgi:superfamily II DNA or RNA helicase
VLKKNGDWGKVKPLDLKHEDLKLLPEQEDRGLLALLVGNETDQRFAYRQFREFAISPAMVDLLLPRLCATGRLGWDPTEQGEQNQNIRPLAWDDGPPWRLQCDLAKGEAGKHWVLSGRLVRDGASEDLSAPLLLPGTGLAIFRDRIARFDPGEDFRWAQLLREGPIETPLKQAQELVAQLAVSAHPPAVDWPEELRWEEDRPTPIPRLKIARSQYGWDQNLLGTLSFQYGEQAVPARQSAAGWYDPKTRRAVRRDLAAEEAALRQLFSFGAQNYRGYHSNGDTPTVQIPPAAAPGLMHKLAGAGWQIESDGKLLRTATAFSIDVASGVDWFDLNGACDFGGESVALPRLLAALRRGEKYVPLKDGAQGMLPEAWLAKYAGIAELGEVQGDALRFLPVQAAFLDALLAAQEHERISVDETFSRLREKLRSFEGVSPRPAPPSFVGDLREYQQEGLGWLHFLDEFAFGGCLADDMGLGKTIQVLAMLEDRRQRHPQPKRNTKKGNGKSVPPRTSLVVVPRSLVFNWIVEAGRFTPELKVLNYTGLERTAAFDAIPEHDLVVTTYGTLRRDIAKLQKLQFDYAILDEAQAIKNSASQAAKACRLIRAHRRLAMTGTPVENHLGDLWSLLEFLNPGMLGRGAKLSELFSGRRGRRAGDGTNDDSPQLALLSRALRPFLLRRTKEQVLSELPDKTEQTLYCELQGEERAAYEELREHFRAKLLQRIDEVGVNKSKIHVLEALLRLRQAACHPGLLDKQQADAPSAKLETLLQQLQEVVEGGHKALVFSQFTSLLAIVRRHLDKQKVVYEYLDGRTAKRQERVDRFQADPACPVFLISLKAGGHGLNLTAADYVFILDPWWNPAVEAQAIDRAHRLGQNQHVFAYRLIAKDTVEEKIVQLQEQKRDLADAIISEDNRVLRNLTAEDLQLLLS